MNKDNAHLFMPLVAALAGGKTIQYRNPVDGRWTDMGPEANITFSRSIDSYRIKQEPKELYAVFNVAGIRLYVVPELRAAEDLAASVLGGYYEKYVQVL